MGINLESLILLSKKQKRLFVRRKVVSVFTPWMLIRIPFEIKCAIFRSAFPIIDYFFSDSFFLTVFLMFLLSPDEKSKRAVSASRIVVRFCSGGKVVLSMIWLASYSSTISGRSSAAISAFFIFDSAVNLFYALGIILVLTLKGCIWLFLSSTTIYDSLAFFFLIVETTSLLSGNSNIPLFPLPSNPLLIDVFELAIEFLKL